MTAHDSSPVNPAPNQPPTYFTVADLRALIDTLADDGIVVMETAEDDPQWPFTRAATRAFATRYSNALFLF